MLCILKVLSPPPKYINIFFTQEIKILGYGSKSIREQIRSFMTYMYSQHGNDNTYYAIYEAKWIVYECTELLLEECISKNLILVDISFSLSFNQPVETLPTVQPFNKLLLADCSISPSKPCKLTRRI